MADKFMGEGHECRIAYGRENVPEKYRSISYRIGSDRSVNINGLLTRVFDNEGFNAKRETTEFLKWAEKFNPDLLWLHNLHGYYINVEMLFDWIKKRPSMEVRWTLHDCWSFTGHCCHFVRAQCDKWKDGCYGCVLKNRYPQSLFFDNSKNNYDKKRESFTGVNNMSVITPSEWLANLVRQSFLKEYPIEVVHNTINTDVFKPTPSDFRERYGLSDKKIVLGVASAWGISKGLYDFVKLSDILDDTYKIVLVGIPAKLQKKLPKKLLMLERTNNAVELAKIYSAADVFVNPSREETFGLTTLEALSCGVPAIVYKNTACEEVARKYGGLIVEQTCDGLVSGIKSVLKDK
ncbi:MAG: glycosyltransferase [Clostridia bacterium]|nr:glycosyltransferase [Clostridia bacterium]